MIWYPSWWRQGQEFAFAARERQTIWRDDSRGDPRPEVALKVEETWRDACSTCGWR